MKSIFPLIDIRIQSKFNIHEGKETKISHIRDGSLRTFMLETLI